MWPAACSRLRSDATALAFCGIRWCPCPVQGLSITPASFSLTAGAGAHASVAGVADVSSAAESDLYTYIAEVQVDPAYQVSSLALLDMISDHTHKLYAKHLLLIRQTWHCMPAFAAIYTAFAQHTWQAHHIWDPLIRVQGLLCKH